MMKHHSLVVDFSCRNFKKIDTKILADEAKELKEIDAVVAVGGMDVAQDGSLDPGKKDKVVTPTAE